MEPSRPADLLPTTSCDPSDDLALDPISTDVNFERGRSRSAVLSVSTIKGVLERAGVEFPEDEAVRMRK